MIHGLQPGPTLFQENAETVYSFIFSLLIANVAFIPIGILCAKYCVKLLAMPKPILASLVLALAVIGSYAVNGSIVEVWVMIGFGALGCAMKHFNLPREPLVLGLVLGTMAESELARALALVQGDVGQLLLGIFSSPICMILIGLILYSIIRSQYKKRKASAKPSDQKTELSGRSPDYSGLPDLFPLPLHEEEEVSSAETGLFGLISSVFGFLFGPLFSHVNLPPVGYKK